MVHRRFLACCLLLLAAVPARADEPAPVRLTLHPGPAPSPALRYRLLPALRDQEPGNAADFYNKALPLLEKIPSSEDDLFTQWEEMPLGQLPRAEVRRALARSAEPLRWIDQGARRPHCDFGVAQRLRTQGISAHLAEIQTMRRASHLLAVRARLALAEGRFDDALVSLRHGLALARHVNEAPTLICHLVALATAATALHQVDAWVGMKGAPNLYWALTDLPRPFLDLRAALQGERLMFFGTFPGLEALANDRKAGPLPEAKVREMGKMALVALPGQTSLPDRVGMALLIRRQHETAKRALMAQGRPRERVEKMPHLQVALLHSLLQYEQFFDEMAKWQSLPLWEAYPHMRVAAQRYRPGVKSFLDGSALPIARLFLPATDKFLLAQARIERRVAALRCIEAIRLHAAAHGKLPAMLDAIQEVPVPFDPLTGKPFAYRLQNGTATLVAPPPAGEAPTANNSLTYELTLAH